VKLYSYGVVARMILTNGKVLFYFNWIVVFLNVFPSFWTCRAVESIEAFWNEHLRCF